MEVRFLPRAQGRKSFLSEESNRKGVGKTLVSPWRKVLENRGFPESEIEKRPPEGTGL